MFDINNNVRRQVIAWINALRDKFMWTFVRNSIISFFVFFSIEKVHLNAPSTRRHSHDDVIKWKHFPRNWPFVRGIHRLRWIPHTKASDAELWCFLWSASDIQIKICAEYRDMLPRPGLVCQEPGLRPIGRSPGVPDKSSRGLGSMSRYSAQILICFIAYIFLLFLCGFGWELCRTAIMHSAPCHFPL